MILIYQCLNTQQRQNKVVNEQSMITCIQVKGTDSIYAHFFISVFKVSVCVLSYESFIVTMNICESACLCVWALMHFVCKIILQTPVKKRIK